LGEPGPVLLAWVFATGHPRALIGIALVGCWPLAGQHVLVGKPDRVSNVRCWRVEPGQPTRDEFWIAFGDYLGRRMHREPALTKSFFVPRI